MSKSNYGDKMTSEEVNEHLKYLAKQKGESGDGLPSMDIHPGEWELAACERLLNASLLREKELIDLLNRLINAKHLLDTNVIDNLDFSGFVQAN